MSDKLKTIEITVPESVVVSLRGDAGEFTFDLSEMAPATIAGVIAKGLKETADDYGSRDADSDEEKAENIRNGARRIQANEHTFGGGGAKLTPTIEQARKWVATALHKQGLAKTLTAARKMAADDLEGSFAEAHPDEDYAEFLAEAREEAERTQKSRWAK